MNVALRQRMTIEELLAWEERQPERREVDGFQPVAMVGGTERHTVIVGNVFMKLRQRPRGGPCRPYFESLNIVAAGSIRYPDVFVACGPTPGTATIANNPVVVFKVLSPSTTRTDVVVKNREYRETPSIMRYVLFAQDGIGLTIPERRGDDRLATSLTDPEATLDMPEIGARPPIAAFHEDVTFEP